MPHPVYPTLSLRLVKQAVSHSAAFEANRADRQKALMGSPAHSWLGLRVQHAIMLRLQGGLVAAERSLW